MAVSYRRPRTAIQLLHPVFWYKHFTYWISLLIYPSEWGSYYWPFHCKAPDELYVVSRQERTAFRVRLILNIFEKKKKVYQRRWQMQFSEHQPVLFSHVVMSCVLPQLLLLRPHHIQPMAKQGIAVVCICTSARSSTVKLLVNQRW